MTMLFRRWRRRINVEATAAQTAIVLCTVIIAGCAQVVSSSNQQIASKAKSTADAVRECALESGTDLFDAINTPAAERTGAQHAVLAAADSKREVEKLEERSNRLQRALDRLRPDQIEAERKINEADALLDLFRPKINFFMDGITELFSIADIISQVTGDPNESSRYDWDDLDGPFSASRRGEYEGWAISSIALAPLGISAVIGDQLGRASARDQLREKQVRKLGELLLSMREMQGLLSRNGLSKYADELADPISAAQTFLDEEADPDRDVRPRQMLNGMRKAINAYTGATDRLIADRRAAQDELDEIAGETRELFDKLNQAEDELKHELKRSQAALEACRDFPGTPGNIDWQRTWWLISSP